MTRLVLITLIVLPALLYSQNRIGTGIVAELYKTHCAVCHGESLRGGLGSSLVDEEWVHGSGDEDIAKVIREGAVKMGMPSYEEILTPEEIRAMVIYIREMAQLEQARALAEANRLEDGVFQGQHHTFRLEKVLGIDGDIFWSISFLPGGSMLLGQFGGLLYVVEDGQLGEPVEGLPRVHRHGQGGLLEVQAHPDYANNGWIYLGYTEASGIEPDGSPTYMTAIVRGRIRDGKWIDQEEIFHVPPDFHSDRGVKNGYLFVSFGDRGNMQQAQDLTLPNGKVHRIHDDGRIPDDNPFVDRKDA